MEQPADTRIYPSLQDLLLLRSEADCFNFLTRRRVRSSLTGNLRSAIKGRGLDFQEIRHYRPGDDIRLIDWRATMRTGHAQVRTFTDERDLPVIILLDLRADMFFGSARHTKSAIAILLAGLITWHTVTTGDRIGAVVLGPDSLLEMAPNRAQQASLRLLRQFVTAGRQLDIQSPPDPEGAALDRAVAITERLITHDHTIVLISDFSNLQSGTALRLGKMTAHNQVFALHVQDPLERDLKPTGTVTASNGTERLTIDLSSPNVRQAFALRQQKRQTEITGDLQTKGINVLSVDTAQPVTAQIRRFGMAMTGP